MASFVDNIFWKVFGANVDNHTNCRRMKLVARTMHNVLESTPTWKGVLHAGNYSWSNCIDESWIKKIDF